MNCKVAADESSGTASARLTIMKHAIEPLKYRYLRQAAKESMGMVISDEALRQT